MGKCSPVKDKHLGAGEEYDLVVVPISQLADGAVSWAPNKTEPFATPRQRPRGILGEWYQGRFDSIEAASAALY